MEKFNVKAKVSYIYIFILCAFALVSGIPPDARDLRTVNKFIFQGSISWLFLVGIVHFTSIYRDI